METKAPRNHGLPQAAARWLRAEVGPYRVIESHRTGSRRTGVWEVASGGTRYFLKLNRRRVRWGTELFAYRNWVPALAPYAPELCGVLDGEDTHGLLLSALDGVPLREAGLGDSLGVSAYEKAGELLARIQSLRPGPWFGIPDERGEPSDDTWDGDAAVYYGRAIGKCAADAREAGVLRAEEDRIVRAVLDSLPSCAFAAPVPTFYDFTPGNWIVDSSGTLLGIIDFENMAWGLPADPFARLVIDYFPESGAGREALYQGYGRDAESQCPEQVLIGCLIYALVYATIAKSDGSARTSERAQRGFTACRRLCRQLGLT